jgi:hypothetical protein
MGARRLCASRQDSAIATQIFEEDCADDPENWCIQSRQRLLNHHQQARLVSR